MNYVDLSHEINNGMPVYPGDFEVSLVKEKHIEKDQFTAYSFKTGLHAGTHIDCPMHMLDSELTMADYQLECFVGKSCMIDARGVAEIDYRSAYDEQIQRGDIVLVFTGTDELYGSSEYYDNHPVITEKFAQLLISKEIKMLGIDMPSPDYSPFPIHKLLLGKGIFIMENLANLERLLTIEHFDVFAAPLKICAEGSLVRAFARW